MRVAIIPASILTDTWQALREGASAGVESTVRWAGPAALARADVQVVTTVVNPKQRVSSGNFEIPYEGTRAMGQALASHQLVNVAQLHAHPADWVGHSSWDDQRAYSSRDHALSIVWPHYGTGLPPIDDWGIHECLGGSWRRLSPSAARDRIRIVPAVLQLRGELEIVTRYLDSELDDEFDEPNGL
jgi:hypothetical protein